MVGLRLGLTAVAVVLGLLLPAGGALAAEPVAPAATALVDRGQPQPAHVRRGPDRHRPPQSRGGRRPSRARPSWLSTSARAPRRTACSRRSSPTPTGGSAWPKAGLQRGLRGPVRRRERVLGASTAGPKRVDVAPRLTARLSRTAARVGSEVTISGSLTQAHPREDGVRIERYYSGAWHLVTTRTLSTTSTYSSGGDDTGKRWLEEVPGRAAGPTGTTCRPHAVLPRLEAYRCTPTWCGRRGTSRCRMSMFAA